MTGHDSAAVAGIDHFLRWYREADFPIRAITIVWAQLLVALIVPWVCYGFWSSRLPARLDVHWDGSGTANQSMSVVGTLAIVSVVVVALGVLSITLILCEEHNAALRTAAGFFSGIAWACVGTFTCEMYASLDREVAEASPAGTTGPGFALGLAAALCTAYFVVARDHAKHHRTTGEIDAELLVEDRCVAVLPIALGIIVAAVLVAVGARFNGGLALLMLAISLTALIPIVGHSIWRLTVTSSHVIVQGLFGWWRLDIPVKEISIVRVEEPSGRKFPVLNSEPDLFVICESGRHHVVVVDQWDGQFIRISSSQAGEVQRLLQPLVQGVHSDGS